MICPNCQFENLEEMNFCGKCRSKLERIYPDCHFSNPPQYSYCGKCGHNLGLSAEHIQQNFSFNNPCHRLDAAAGGGDGKRRNYFAADGPLKDEMKTMVRNLFIGYGNMDRQDDGVGFLVVNCLRRHLAQKPLARNDDGLLRLGRRTDSIFIRQLKPELSERVAHYFVDAHIPADMPHLACTRLHPEDGTALFSHHMHPAQLLGHLKALWNREPLSYLLSIQGCRFGFGRRLSAKTAKLAVPATAMILELFESLPDPLPPAAGRKP